MKYMVGIGYVNRLDLLFRALRSIEIYWPHTIVFDNSDNKDLRKEYPLLKNVTVCESPVPLTFPQMMNVLIEKASAEECDVIIHIHSDTEAYPGSPERFLELLQSLQDEGRKWGLAFTRADGTDRDYDYLIAYNMKALKEVGNWDTNFPQYFADTDYYWRIHLAGYEHIRTGIPVKHEGSSVMLSDPYRFEVFRNTIRLYRAYYKRKWGGTWFQEIYAEPFAAGKPECVAAPPPGWHLPQVDNDDSDSD